MDGVVCAETPAGLSWNTVAMAEWADLSVAIDYIQSGGAYNFGHFGHLQLKLHRSTRLFKGLWPIGNSTLQAVCIALQQASGTPRRQRCHTHTSHADQAALLCSPRSRRADPRCSISCWCRVRFELVDRPSDRPVTSVLYTTSRQPTCRYEECGVDYQAMKSDLTQYPFGQCPR